MQLKAVIGFLPATAEFHHPRKLSVVCRCVEIILILLFFSTTNVVASATTLKFTSFISVRCR